MAGRGLGAIILDMDGVIADTNPFHRLAWRRFAAEVGREVSEESLRRHVFGWRTEEAIVNLWGTPADGPAEVARMASRKEATYRELARGRLQATPGLETFVRRVRAAGLRLGLATSACRENVEMVLGTLGLDGVFDAVVVGEEVRVAKPNPEIFLEAARRLDVEPARCLVVEDSLSGIAAARAAGMRCVALTTTHTEQELLAAGAERAAPDFTEVELG